VLQIVKHLGDGGGVEHVALELQRAWRRAAIDTRVLASSVADEGDRKFVDFAAPWTARIGAAGGGRYLGRLIGTVGFTIAATWRLRRVAKDRVVVSHGDSFAGDICVIHAVNAASVAEKRRQGQWRWMLNPMHAWVGLRDRTMIGGLRYKRYVAVSNRVVSELQHHYGVPASRIVVIPNGVNIERFSPASGDRADVRREFGIPGDAPLLLFAGHEFGRKGLAYVIAALGRLPRAVHLLVVGADNPSPYLAIAEQAGLASGRVVFAGARRDLERIYPAADAFVLPTYYETFALVCMEAMAAGLPLFATRVGGIEDYLDDGVNGYFIQRDAADIADRVGRALADPSLLARMGQAARRTAEAHAWPAIAQQYVDLLHTVAATRSAGVLETT
jgi:UDP-glucose:(heptosyl)LPS alpha-1,3-glucosyltransferase